MMPIEIRELHIKINVDESNKTKNQSGKKSIDQEELVASCVEAVMEILQNQKQR